MGERGLERVRARVGRTSISLQSIVLRGVLSTILVVVGGALSGAADPDGSGRLWSVPTIPVRPSINLVFGLGLYFGGLIMLVRSWLLLRRRHLTSGVGIGAVVVVVVLWSLPFLVGPPLGSRDVYAYAAQGRLADQGFDVYADGPAALGDDDPVLAPVDPLYRETPSLYGPLFVVASSGIAAIVDDHVVGAVMGFRLLAVLGLVISAVAVFDLARGLGRDPVDALVLAMANPLTLLHLVSGAHNEALMLGFLLAGVAVARRGRPLLGIALCTLGATVKLPALLAVAFIAWPWAMSRPRPAQRSWSMMAAGLISVGVMAVVGALTGYGWTWVEAISATRPVDAYLSVTRVLGGGLSLLLGLDPGRILAAARLIGLVTAAVAIGFLLLNRYRSWPAALAWSLVTAAVLHPTTQPWYLTWGVILLAATGGGERNRALVTACAASAFVVLPMGPQLGLVVLDSAGATTLIAAVLVLSVLTLSPAGERRPRRRVDLDHEVVSLIVPIRHEAPNVGPFVEAVDQMVQAAAWQRLGYRRVEVLFVDDSDDDTPATVRSLIRRRRPQPEAIDEPRSTVTVALHHRNPQQRWGGLGGAVVDGFGLAAGATAVVMDGDLQHPAFKIPELLSNLRSPRPDDHEPPGIVVASRRADGGSFGQGLTPSRRRLSLVAATVARVVFPATIGGVTDPLSGFFVVRLDQLDLNRLHPDGFKILIEVVVTHPDLVVAEVPFRFVGRLQGMSKATASEGARFLGHLLDLRVRMWRPWAGAPLTQRAFGTSSASPPFGRQPPPATRS